MRISLLKPNGSPHKHFKSFGKSFALKLKYEMLMAILVFHSLFYLTKQILLQNIILTPGDSLKNIGC